MRTPPLLIVLIFAAGAAGAQPAPFFVTDQREPAQVSVSTVYQRYVDDGSVLEEASVPLVVTVPLGSRLGFSLAAVGAAAGGDDAENLGGFADVQTGLSLRQPFGQGSIVANVGFNVPSGRGELSADEFATSVLLSQEFYDFRLPTFGQGFGASPGITLAYPVSDRLVLGAGVAYQYKAAFTPVTTMDAEFDPGDELLLTGGLDVRLAETSAASADVTYSTYGRDELGGNTYFESGDRLTATVQYLQNIGFDELRIVARYSSKGKGRLPAAGGGLITEAERTVPSRGRFRVFYRKRTTPTTSIGLLAQARIYNDTVAFSRKQLFDAGVQPEMRVTEAATLFTRFAYTFGSFQGLEASAGVSVEL